MIKPRKIDIHAHASLFPHLDPGLPMDGQKMPGAEELIEMYDRLNIEKGVLLPLVGIEAQRTPLTSEACKVMADHYSDRFFWFCGMDPRMGDNTPNCDLSFFLNHYKSLGARGVGELTANLHADDPLMDNLFDHCEDCDMPVIIHIGPQIGGCYGIVDEVGLPRIEKMLKKHPRLTLIGHSQPFWSEISAGNSEAVRNTYPRGKVIPGRLTELMREYGNLYCDLSAGSGANAMMRDPEHAARFMEEFSDRILYGCDICATKNTHPFVFDAFLDKLLEEGMLTMENYTKIVRGNALRVLKV